MGIARAQPIQRNGISRKAGKKQQWQKRQTRSQS
jgi:hypothetical protein